MKKTLLLLTIKSIVLLGLTFQPGYATDHVATELSDIPPELVSQDHVATELSDLPPELVSQDRVATELSDLPPEIMTLIITFCPKSNYNNLSVVSKEFFDITNDLTTYCRFKKCYEESILRRFNRLTRSTVNDRWITVEDLAALHNLITLNLENNRSITVEDLAALPNLTTLNLWG